jgi:hypothetical protein
MKNQFNIYSISNFDYDISVLLRILKGPNYETINIAFSNYLDI